MMMRGRYCQVEMRKNNMKKIGILYICTGAYSVFWKNFYETFEEKFLPNTEKHYFVFTDAKKIDYEEKENVKVHELGPQPWPLVTLLRFHTFLSIREELETMDYLMFSNANMQCDDVVLEENFLPRVDEGEELSFTKHPGYADKEMKYVPYDRNPECLAYIPYNLGKDYVIGAMFAGTKDAYLSMCEILRDRINEDLKKGVIAKWHDESHINRFIIGKKVRVLSPSYCYPWGMQVAYPSYISAVSKQDKFDVKTFKGFYDTKEKKSIKKAWKKLCTNPSLCFFFDKLMNKKLEVL